MKRKYKSFYSMKMKNRKQYINKSVFIMGVGGFILLIAGILLKTFLPALQSYFKLIQGIGIFLFVTAIFNYFQSLNYKRNPEAMRKAQIESLDERKLWIRYRSGNNAFLFGIGITYLALLLSGVSSETISADLVWWVLAVIVVLTMMVYIVSLIIYEQKY